jgi:superfamily II DNA or RNA helicase
MTTTDDYRAFVAGKGLRIAATGIDLDARSLPHDMFDWQRGVTVWGLRKGRAAMFLNTGLGKSIIALAWADAVAKHTGMPVLILTPLAVGPQFVSEADKFGVPGVELWRDGSAARIQVVNYHKLHHIRPADYGGVVIDESSILKAYSGRTRTELCDAFAACRFKLACTATPSPNDVDELGNHAEFLGVCTRLEMLSKFFIHDSSDTSKWRLKGHAEDQFWEWVASWAMVMRHPSDIGMDAPSGYDLPPLETIEHVVDSPVQAGRLVAMPAETLSEQRVARASTRDDRVAKVVELVNGDDAQWVVWCERNDEGDALEKAIAGAVQVAGCDTDDDKVERMTGFVTGKYRVLVSKASVCGFGMNWQHCNRMAFVGLSHSFEQFYQAVRRCWRFGQTNPVTVHVVTSDIEWGVLANVKRKHAAHDGMFDRMIRHTAAVNRRDVTGECVSAAADVYSPRVKMKLPEWLSA